MEDSKFTFIGSQCNVSMNIPRFRAPAKSQAVSQFFVRLRFQRMQLPGLGEHVDRNKVGLVVFGLNFGQLLLIEQGQANGVNDRSGNLKIK